MSMPESLVLTLALWVDSFAVVVQTTTPLTWLPFPLMLTYVVVSVWLITVYYSVIKERQELSDSDCLIPLIEARYRYIQTQRTLSVVSFVCYIAWVLWAVYSCLWCFGKFIELIADYYPRFV